jgi:homoserine O-acetyltransferase/O-succinyltransferase
MMSFVPIPTIEDDFTFACAKPFPLDFGRHLQPVTLRYAMYGTLNRQRDNAILVCHALSGSARTADWWPEMFGPEGILDTERHCVIGINVIGSCYGSTGPGSLNPLTGEPYGKEFPVVSVSDMVRAQAQLLDLLAVKQLRAVVGSSLGGMQALQWAVDFPERVETCIAIGAAPLSAMGLALNHLQRQAIRNDPAWSNGSYDVGNEPVAGLALARAIAVCSYKSADLFAQRFARKPDRSGEDPCGSLAGRYDVAGYLDYQGKNFTRRFDANSYLVLSKAMDTFDLARGYESEAAALRRITARMLLVGISSDWLFPPTDVLALTERMQGQGVEASYRELNSSHGHDGFLADAELLVPIVKLHLNERRYSALASAGGTS